MEYTFMDTPVGRLLLAGDAEGLCLIAFPDGRNPYDPDPAWQENSAAFEAVVRQLNEYFEGRRKTFSFPHRLTGTPFQQRVLQALQDVGYGDTVSYGELARRAGSPKAARAVGMANATNPLPIVIPCHRVIGSNGKLTGYGGGLHIKETLLDLEQRYR